jgi:hypothetical protein
VNSHTWRESQESDDAARVAERTWRDDVEPCAEVRSAHPALHFPSALTGAWRVVGELASWGAQADLLVVADAAGSRRVAEDLPRWNRAQDRSLAVRPADRGQRVPRNVVRRSRVGTPRAYVLAVMSRYEGSSRLATIRAIRTIVEGIDRRFRRDGQASVTR